jgi:class 3 adenylate cyclase
MSVRAKLYLIVLPLMSVAIVLGVSFAYSVAASVLEDAATENLNQKAAWLQSYANDQALLLVDEGYFGDEYMREAAFAGIEKYADSLLQSEAEIIAAFDDTRRLVFFAGNADRQKDAAQLAGFNRKYVTAHTPSEAFLLQIYTARERRDILKSLDNLIVAAFLILISALILAVIFLHVLSGSIIKPIIKMKSVFDGYSFNRLSQKIRKYPAVTIPAGDEMGALAASYNVMMAKFAAAEHELNMFARGKEAKKNIEEKRRNIFQLYTPNDVVRKVLNIPQDLLTSAKYNGAILYSGVRRIAPLSENLPPAKFVSLINRYFVRMTAIVRKKAGVNFNIEGDALLAGWGVPEPKTKDAVNAVHTALLMIHVMLKLNKENIDLGLPPLEIGIGLDSGFVTAGNIASDNKINWTVMGGPVTLAVQVQKLTKEYKTAVLFTENIYKKVYTYFPCRFVDKVTLAGSQAGVSLFTARLKITGKEQEAWKHHRTAVKLFYARKFTEALIQFEQTLLKDPEDSISAIFISRCRRYMKTPPPPMWDGSTNYEYAELL